MNKNIRLVLIDDHSLFRESLGRLLAAEEHFKLAGSFSDIDQAVANPSIEEADIVLLDFDLGEEKGVNILKKLRHLRFGGRILMVTAGMRKEEQANAIREGVAGIFLKHSPPADLIKAIYRVAAGEMWFDHSLVRAMVGIRSGRADRQSLSALSDREKQVLKCVFAGLTNKEISTEVSISESYVKAILQQLFDKTAVRTRAQLVRVALEQHLL